MTDNIENNDMEEFDAFKPNKVKQGFMMAGIIIFGIALFFGILYGSLYVASAASSAVISGLGLPPAK